MLNSFLRPGYIGNMSREHHAVVYLEGRGSFQEVKSFPE